MIVQTVRFHSGGFKRDSNVIDRVISAGFKRDALEVKEIQKRKVLFNNQTLTNHFKSGLKEVAKDLEEETKKQRTMRKTKVGIAMDVLKLVNHAIKETVPCSSSDLWGLKKLI
ncbi:hypothetical protein AB3S75_041149 [Citrus x aurantiifolia]